jgi:ADP-ribosylation factor-binding protein GGA
VTENLKSPEELENEDREAQSAVCVLAICSWMEVLSHLCMYEQKLQELLRRGTPKDLAAAQELMKILAGAVCPPYFFS